jgi:Protein of unknown function (DUF3106)
MKTRWLTLMLVAVLLPLGLEAQPGRRHRPGGPGPGGEGPGGPGGRRALERWAQMSPEERQRRLENMPPERRKHLEERLRRYNNLTPEERGRLRERYANFSGLPPEKQDEARRLFGDFRQLPLERRAAVRKEFVRLRGMSEEDRRARLGSEEFRSSYSPQERELVEDLSEIAALPEAR